MAEDATHFFAASFFAFSSALTRTHTHTHTHTHTVRERVRERESVSGALSWGLAIQSKPHLFFAASSLCFLIMARRSKSLRACSVLPSF